MWQIIDMYLGLVVILIGVFYFARIILGETAKISKKKLIIVILGLSLANTFIYMYLKGTIKTLLILFINTCLYKIAFKVTTKKAIFLTFLYMALLVPIDLLELFFFTDVLNINKEFFYNKVAGSTLANLSVGLLLVGTGYILRKPLKKLLETKIDSNKKIVALSFVTFICILMFFYTIIKEFKINNDVILYLVAIIILMIVLQSLIKQTIDNNNLKNKYDKLLEFMRKYEREIDKQRTKSHEVTNEFRTIRAKIIDKQANKEIIEYIDEILNEKYEIKEAEYVKFGYLPPNGIKGLCYFKIQEAEEKGINVAVNISKRVEKSTIFKLTTKDQKDFGRILGVYLDNAIEASNKSKEKQLGLEIYVNEEKECKIIITNTYSDKIDKNKIGKEVFSTKGKTRGHGLILVKQIVGSNDLFEVKTDIQEKLYIQTILIKKK